MMNELVSIFLGVTKDEWLEGLSSIYTKYQSIFEKYHVVIETEDKKSDETLSLIEQTRAKNNVNWMALLRICVEKDPETSKPIIQEILNLDREISDLTAKLVED